MWAWQNIDPKHINPGLTTSEPYAMGSHVTCSGVCASGPEDYAPSEYRWGYSRTMTVEGLFGTGDTIGGTAHKVSSGSFTEGRIAAMAVVKYVMEKGWDAQQVSEAKCNDLDKLAFQPLETYRVGRNEIVAGTVLPSVSCRSTGCSAPGNCATACWFRNRSRSTRGSARKRAGRAIAAAVTA
jgi:adenylylsulfate reductase, subunit A